MAAAAAVRRGGSVAATAHTAANMAKEEAAWRVFPHDGGIVWRRRRELCARRQARTSASSRSCAYMAWRGIYLCRFAFWRALFGRSAVCLLFLHSCYLLSCCSRPGERPLPLPPAPAPPLLPCAFLHCSAFGTFVGVATGPLGLFR